ncbi:MAG TPA: patatin-like phospholipase family protein [Pyrinomonadaceae bacterium]|jgi:predicted acylesterase/phospholipase RssA|nr:patatin-like phospholipase family protein [Pyrinomonadaceae bacterium]
MEKRDLGLIFAAGGNRSFYQLGLMRRWRDKLLPRTGVIAACSAGACMAVLSLTGREAEAEEFWNGRREGLTKNFEWGRLLRGERPTLHERIYRETLLCALDGGGFERVRSQPFPVYVLTTGYPKRLPPMLAALLGLWAYKLDSGPRRGAGRKVSYASRAGFTAVAYDARACDSASMLADLIIASSATPPFTAVGRVAGRRLLDGGIISTVPIFLTDSVPGVTRRLVFMTSPLSGTSRAGAADNIFYAAPSAPLEVATWDLTKPELIEKAIRTGEEDAVRLDGSLDDFLTGS